MKIFLYYIGKPRDEHFNELADEYIKRSGRFCTCEMREIQPSRFDLWAKHKTCRKILLSPEGKMLNSFQFSEVISKGEQDGKDLVFVIGGADGLPPGWNERADVLLSLSPLTFPHEFARVMLAEQVYRAFTILRGHPYSK